MSKSVIRQNIWETNSSTTHSCVIVMKSDYERWKNDEYYILIYDSFIKLLEDKKPKYGLLYTTDEVIEFYRLYGWEYNQKEYSSKKEFIDEMGDFMSYEKWCSIDLEYDEHYFTTPNGDEIVVCCKYGEDY